jgi:hypothetical protein
MTDVKLAGFTTEELKKKWVFFEPKPVNRIDDGTLEGCLRYASRREQLVDQ